MSNTLIKSWIETVKPVATWIVIVAILIQCAWSSFAHFVLFPAGILQSLSSYTGHILHPTFTAYVLLSICMGFLLCYIGGLRARDFGIFHKQILPAVGFTLLAWAIIQLSPLLSGNALVVDPIWSEQGELMHKFSRFFMSQLFGNALYEELFYRALLISQFTILFRKKCSTTKALIFAVICSQLLFALIHIPHRIVSGIPFDQMILPMVNLFIAGLLFTALFLLSKNIFIPVGVHALANKSPNIFEQCDNQFGVISIILIFLAILFWKRICRKKLSAIVILGHSGSGKTTVGEWVANHLGIPCIDTDDIVLEHLGKTSIQSVWDEGGEANWQEAEAEIIPGLLKEDTVVILGGQISMPASVKEAIANMPMIINCVADEETALLRIAKCEDRLVHDLDEVQLRSERVKEYGQLATHELDTNGDFVSAIPKIKALLALNPKN